MTDQKRQSSPSTIQADGSEEFLWDVQEILAERTSISGENEFLVVWKTSWVPVSNMMQDGAEMHRFRDAPKCEFVSPAGTLHVECQPGTTLASDFNTATIEAQRVRAEQRAAVINRVNILQRNFTPSNAAKRPSNSDADTDDQ